MDENNATAVIWRRLPYVLSPQLDIYERLPSILVGGPKVMEVGFGTGIGVLQYASTVEWVDAMEIDPNAVRFAQRCFPLPNVQWMEDDILNLSRHPIYYDFLVMIEVLEHIQDTDRVLSVLNLLARNVLLTVPNSLRYRRKPERLNEHEWTPRTFVEILSRHFHDVKLLNYELKEAGDPDNRETPIIALCSSV